MLNFLYLGRAMIHANGCAPIAAFQSGGNPVIDTSQLFYDGNSQGGILGGALTAVAPDFKPRRARCAGDELLDPARAQRRLRAIRRGQVHGQVCGLFPAPLDDICTTALPATRRSASTTTIRTSSSAR